MPNLSAEEIRQLRALLNLDRAHGGMVASAVRRGAAWLLDLMDQMELANRVNDSLPRCPKCGAGQSAYRDADDMRCPWWDNAEYPCDGTLEIPPDRKHIGDGKADDYSEKLYS